MVLPPGAESDAALLQEVYKVVEQHTKTYVQPTLATALELERMFVQWRPRDGPTGRRLTVTRRCPVRYRASAPSC